MLKVKRFIVLCLIVLLSVLLVACGGARTGNKDNAQEEDIPELSAEEQEEAYILPESIGGISTGAHDVIATVNGEAIYEDVFMEWYLGTISLRAGLDMSAEQNEQVVSFIEAYKSEYLTDYAEQIILLLQEAKKINIIVDEEEVLQNRREIMEITMSDEESFPIVQSMWGFTDKNFRRYLKNQLLIEHLFAEITKDVTGPEQDPQEYYNENPAEFLVDETRIVRHILVEDSEEAEAIIAALNAGADFGELVKTKSIDYGSSGSGGVIGPFDSFGYMSDGSALVPVFTDASFALEKAGDITQSPAASDYGFHIILLDEIFPARSMSFDEVREELESQLLMDAKERAFNEYFSVVIANADISFTEDFAQPAPQE